MDGRASPEGVDQWHRARESVCDALVEAGLSLSEVVDCIDEPGARVEVDDLSVSYTHLTLPTNREV